MADLGILFFRVTISALMMIHGWSKITGFSEMSHVFPDPLGLGSTLALCLTIFAEFFCSLAVVFGLWTRLALLPLITTMAVAALSVHSHDPWAKKELAVMYLIPFITLLFTGPGQYSFDKKVLR